uniref:E3 ubiquitin ligase TRAF3IP2 n=1 Tax=Scatophagus argus TaxID=75038 RepID=UPI001ED7FA11|nr:E3 ubiquitin ligase TRAF3IP2 [Scatophagus argus]XP_046246612.1 E3 ubiquitin ligase TRAF3IP2 [Scatophagus argus]XP_046246613.1 E3 ubiquitin ligase TRAF3IP2 [Scatophagus argus]XP_046246614.1 E3 ubiquitin ligase TRAF3IP2 [Scatophagus argus]XP_046246616.1 E3 ubiquitin ligase TRAF3IP2 [Scatophagus argus]XP_046246617.1 E3 ubiquitin ligase TRAF3IP2 [Scatophagus argus]
MSGGGAPMMMPTSVYSASAPNSHVYEPKRYPNSHRNTPEEDDETMSTVEREANLILEPDSNPDGYCTLAEHDTLAANSLFSRQRLDREQEHKHSHTLSQPDPSYFSYQLPRSLPAGFSQPTPFPSQVDGSWIHPSLASNWSGYPNSLPSSGSQKDFSSCTGDSCKSLSDRQTDRHSISMSSLEQPFSLCSNPPSANLCHHTLPPYSYPPQEAACGAQCPVDAFTRQPVANKALWPPHPPACGPYYPGDCRLPGTGYTQIGHIAPAKEKNPAYSTPLSLEQRRVFVTYEADNDKHVNEIINFVALLRHNGFDTHIDIFEQQFRSISKIDFMERYLSEKEYLIIIIISPKYYETVTASPVGLENDERTFNTVYIHKQLQNEFIQNGSKNFRFIPILFPGAKKCHVPNWLQNTHVYGWPRDRDDILRRLMRVEKYNPPPIGQLPTIVSIPI